MKLVLFLILSVAFVGCGYTEGIVQKSPKSYLWFTGKTQNAFAFIDDREPFEVDNRKTTHFQIAPGKHKIIVKKNDQIVVNRVLLIGDGMTKEIQVP